MAWDFETDPEYQKKLDWAAEFVREEVEPLDHLFPHQQFVPMTDTMRKIIDPLKDEVRAQGLWATHLGPELGGQGFGQLKLALLNEILGRSPWASNVFGTQAPDTGNAEIIAHYGTPEQKERYLQPLLDGEMFSTYSMTEPHAGADPTLFTTAAVKDGGGGRIHHAMRTIGLAQKAIDMMCERALSRETAGSLLADKQFVQGYIADSYAQLVQFRLFVLYTAWEIDKYNDYKRVRKDIATAKVVMPTVLHDIAWRAMQVHGALGTTNEMPFFMMIHGAGAMGLADGPTEVHKVTVARQVLRDYHPTDGMWPTEWIPGKIDFAKAKYADHLELEVGNL